MKWLIKKLLAFFGLYSTPVPVLIVEKVNPFEASKKSIVIGARTVPFRSGSFYYSRHDLVVLEGFWDEFGIKEQEVVLATPPRRYGALPLSELAPGASVPLSRLEDIAALITAQPNGRLGFLYTGGVPSIFYAKGKDGEVREGFVFHSREFGLPAWYVGVRQPGDGPSDPGKTWVVYPTEEL